MHTNTIIRFRCVLLATLLLGLNASAQFPWLNRFPSGGCCPGCGSPDDPLGPRYRSQPIGLTLDTNSSRPSLAAGSMAKTNTAAGNPVIGSGASSSALTRPTNAAPEFIASGTGKYELVSFAQLASFDFTIPPKAAVESSDSIAAEARVREQVPENVRSLSEKPIALTGFMLPLRTRSEMTTDFLLLRNQSACCYGVMPKINEWVFVRTTGKGVKVLMDTPVTVLGTFHVGASGESRT